MPRQAINRHDSELVLPEYSGLGNRQYGPMRMIIPASGHQVRCIPWVQMGTFNKEIGIFMWIEILCIEYILWGIPTIESTFDFANMVETATVKDVPINDDALLYIQTC